MKVSTTISNESQKAAFLRRSKQSKLCLGNVLFLRQVFRILIMKKLSVLLLISSLISGCFMLRSIERRIGERIDNCQPNTDCIIKIAGITDFQWDKMFVFDYGVPFNEIQKHTGTEYGSYEEFKRQLVFINDGKIIHQENLLTHVSEMVDGAVQFDGLNYNRPLSFTPDTAVLKAKRYTVGYGDINYYLKRVE